MGRGISLGILVFISFITKTIWADPPTTVPINVNYAFIPVGYDDNDKVEVMVAGMFPSTCYKVGPYDFRIDEATRTIFIDQKAYEYSGLCSRMLVPFTSLINLRILADNNYVLRDGMTGAFLGSLPVTRAKVPEADDFLYAQVKEAYVHSQGNKTWLNLKGVFTSRCVKLKEIRINYYDHVIVVQPILENLNPHMSCSTEIIRFQFKKELKPGLDGTQLLHVRAMDGKAINQLVEFP